MKKKFISMMMAAAVIISSVPMENYIVYAAEDEFAGGDSEDFVIEQEDVEENNFSDDELVDVDEFAGIDSYEDEVSQEEDLQLFSSDDAGNSDPKTLTGMEFKLDKSELEIVPDGNMWFSGTMVWKYGTEEHTEKYEIINSNIGSAQGEEAALIVKDENGKIVDESAGELWWQQHIDTSYTMYFQCGDVKSNSFVVNVRHKDLSNTPLLALGNNTVALGEYGIAPTYLWYKFVPDETAVYRFASDSFVASSGFRCVDDKGNPAFYNYHIQPGEQWIGNLGGFQLIKGKDYYIGVKSNSEGISTGKVTINRVDLDGCQWERVGDTEIDCQVGGTVTETCLTHKGETRTVNVSPKSHTPGEWMTEKEATVLETGTRVQKCTVCGKVVNTQTIGRLQATVTLNVEDIVSLKVGQTFGVTATDLAKGDSVRSWTSSNTEIATVSSEGTITAKKTGMARITVMLASGLQKTFRVQVSLIPVCEAEGQHIYGEWKIIKDATCSDTGIKEQICTRCENVNTETIPKKSHTPGEWMTEKEATVLETGTRVQKCTVCGKFINTQTIAKLPATFTLNVPVNKTLPMKTKQTFQAKITGLATGDKVVSWSSSNKKAVTVSQNGTIRAAKKTGKSVITATLLSGTTAKFTVNVQKKDVTTSSLKVLNKATGKNVAKKVTLKRKEKLNLSAVIAPVTSKQKVTFTSSKKSVVAVNAKGVVTAKKKGKATITVKSGKKVVKIRITVK